MKKHSLSQKQCRDVSNKIHRSTINMTLVILILGIIILPWSNRHSPAFIPLILSIAISLITLISATISLYKQNTKTKEVMKKLQVYKDNSHSNTSL